MLNVLVLKDTGYLREGQPALPQVDEGFEVIAKGLRFQFERVDVVVLTGERLLELVVQSQDFFETRLSEALRRNGIMKNVGKPYGSLACEHDTSESLREQYGDLRFVSGPPRDMFVAYRLE